MSERDELNRVLHAGAKPCRSACSHVIAGRWTALGIANVLARVRDGEPPERTPAERILSKLQLGGVIPWDGWSETRLAVRTNDGDSIDLDTEEAAALMAICQADYEAVSR